MHPVLIRVGAAPLIVLLCGSPLTIRMYSTVLFVDGLPAAYTIIRDRDRYLLLPTDKHQYTMSLPRLYAFHQEDHWVVEGTECRNLVDQVVEDLISFES